MQEEDRLTGQIDGGTIDSKDPTIVEAQTWRAADGGGDDSMAQGLKNRGTQGFPGDANCGVGDGLRGAEGTLEEVIHFTLKGAFDLIEEQEDQTIEGQAPTSGEGGGPRFMVIDEVGVSQAFKYP